MADYRYTHNGNNFFGMYFLFILDPYYNFEVKSFYKVLSPKVSQQFSWKSIWNVKVPTKVAFLYGQQLWGES